MAKKTHILVLSGGVSSEHEVSLKTGEMVLKHLNKGKYLATPVVIERDGKWKFPTQQKTYKIENVTPLLKNLKIDLIFIALHGTFGEDGRIQALCELLELPYTGSGVLSSAMAMDKNISNILFKAGGLSVPHYILVEKENEDKALKFPLPAVIKPVIGGSSVGVSIVQEEKDIETAIQRAFKEDSHVMIQSYIKGRELTCGVLEDENGKPFALPPTEIVPNSSSFFDYNAKYKEGGSLEVTPPQLSVASIKKLQSLALKAHKALGCRGVSRTDFILRGSTFYILETNTLPGMTGTSLLPQAALVAGIGFPDLLDRIVSAGFRARGR